MHLGKIEVHLGNIIEHLGKIEEHLGKIVGHLSKINMYLGNREGPENRWRVCGGGRLLMVGQEAACQGALGALMAAASALAEEEQQRGRGGGCRCWTRRDGGGCPLRM